jgi:DNA-binding phage protein
MPLTYSFKETVLARIRNHPGFRVEMLIGALEELLAGDIAVGKSVLRDVINGTIGFEVLAERVGLPSKSLMRMFGPNGNPQAKNLFAVIAALQKDAGITLEVAAKPAAKRRAHSPSRSEKIKPRPAARARSGEPSTAQPGFAEKASRFKRR